MGHQSSRGVGRPSISSDVRSAAGTSRLSAADDCAVRCPFSELPARTDIWPHPDGDSAVKDAALIAAAQRVEHYEIAGYGAARNFAQQLGHNDLAHILQETLDEEGEADHKLTEIATSFVNSQAARA